MDEQTRLWVFGGLFLLIGVVLLVRGFLVSRASARATFLVSGLVLVIAGCAEVYFAVTFQEGKAEARPERERLNQTSRDMDRVLQEQAEREMRERVPVLGDRSAERNEAHNQQVDGTRP